MRLQADQPVTPAGKLLRRSTAIFASKLDLYRRRCLDARGIYNGCQVGAGIQLHARADDMQPVRPPPESRSQGATKHGGRSAGHLAPLLWEFGISDTVRTIAQLHARADDIRPIRSPPESRSQGAKHGVRSAGHLAPLLWEFGISDTVRTVAQRNRSVVVLRR